MKDDTKSSQKKRSSMLIKNSKRNSLSCNVSMNSDDSGSRGSFRFGQRSKKHIEATSKEVNQQQFD